MGFKFLLSNVNIQSNYKIPTDNHGVGSKLWVCLHSTQIKQVVLYICRYYFGA